MNRIRSSLIALLFCFSMFPVCVHADIDHIQSEMLKQYPLPLRWDNIEGPPEWVGGNRMAYNRDKKHHSVSLAPGEAVVVKVPAGERLRVVSMREPFSDNELDVTVSNGSGLWAALPCQKTNDPFSIITAYETLDPYLVHLERPPDVTGPIEIGLFLTRKSVHGTLCPYRGEISFSGLGHNIGQRVGWVEQSETQQLIGVGFRSSTQPTGNSNGLKYDQGPSSGPEVQVVEGCQGDKKRYVQLSPGNFLEIATDKQTRWVIENRFIYPSGGGDMGGDRIRRYRVVIEIDGQYMQTLEFETQPESKKPVWIGKTQKLTGRLERGYVDIPDGSHRIRIIPQGNLLLRILEQEKPDYLIGRPGVNAPESPAVPIDVDPTGMLNKDVWHIPFDPLPSLAPLLESPALAEKTALRLIKENAVYDNALSAIQMLKRVSQLRPDYPLIQNRAAELTGLFTFYRNLPPAWKHSRLPLKPLYFCPRSLYDIHESKTPTIVSPAHMEDMLRYISSALFTPLEAQTSQTPAVFHLPQRPSDSTLRIVVEKTSSLGARIMCQVDSREPIPISTKPLLKTEPQAFKPSVGDLGWVLAGDRQHRSDLKRFSRHMPPALTETGWVELPLPRSVKQVKVWREDKLDHPLYFSVQYRTGKPYQLTDQEAQAMLQVHGNPQKIYETFLKALTETQPDALFQKSTTFEQYIENEVTSHLLPLAKFIRSRANRFGARFRNLENLLSEYVTPTLAPEKSSHLYSADQVIAKNRQAKKFKTEEQYLDALETYFAIVQHSTGNTKADAVFGAANCLDNLGESYMADHMLRWIVTRATEHRIIEAAFGALEQKYDQEKRPELLMNLYAFHITRNPSLDGIKQLSTHLIDTGRYGYGLPLGMLLPGDHQPLGHLLRAAFHLDDRQIYQQLIEKLPEGREKSFWHAQRSLKEGEWAAARKFLKKAGTTRHADAYLEMLNSGEKIQKDLFKGGIHADEGLIRQWFEWQAKHPGPYFWDNANQLVDDCQGSVFIHSKERDLYATTFHGTSIRPVTFRVMGPTRLKLLARPIHQKGATESGITAINTWIHVDSDYGKKVVPVTRNLPVSALSIIGQSGWTPGRQIESEISVPPGLHEYRVWSQDCPLLVQVEQQQPELPIPILPDAHPHKPDQILQAHFMGSMPRQRFETETAGSASGLWGACGQAQPWTLGFWKSDCNGPTVFVIPNRENIPPYGFMLDNFTDIQANHSPGPADSHIEYGMAKQEQHMPDVSSESPMMSLISAGNPENLMGFIDSDKLSDPYEKMVLLAWIAETHPEHYGAILPRAERLYMEQSGNASMGSVYRRLTHNTSWERVSQVVSSAGIRYLDLKGWHPDSGRLKIKKALLAPMQIHEHILYDDQRYVFSFHAIRQTDLEIRMLPEEILGFENKPMTVSFQVDQGKEMEIHFPNGGPGHVIKKTIPAGDHALTFRMKERFENQFLRIEIRDQRNASKAQGQPYVTTPDRFGPMTRRQYHIATQDEPVQIDVEGPAWVRVDALGSGSPIKNGHSGTSAKSRYISVDPGWQTLSIPPKQDQTESLYRIFKKVKTADRKHPGMRIVNTAPVSVMPPVIFPEKAKNKKSVELIDQFPLGGQEDGTWSLGVGFVGRKLAEAEDLGSDQSEQYIETEAVYRHFEPTPWGDGYFKGRFLGRIRNSGGPTWGLGGRYDLRPDNRPIRISLSGNIFAQHPDGWNEGGLEWRSYLRAALSDNRRWGTKTGNQTEISLFKQFLSMSGYGSYEPNTLDRDIFTGYKMDHQHGIRLTDTFRYRPWLDTIWSVKAGISTNENFIEMPDHADIRTAWKQRIGNGQIDGGLKYTFYFDDDDRDRTLDRWLATLKTNWDVWLTSQYRFELGLNLSYEFNTGKSSAQVLFKTHFGNGRMYRDFMPGEIDFKSIRKQKIRHEMNNAVY